jgi:hypothetical protein
MSRLLGDWIKEYMEYSRISEAPDNFHFWTAIGTIAGALRRHVWMDQKIFSWFPNFYIIFVAPPGVVSKSTTASIGMNILRDVPGIQFGPDSSTWQALVQSLSNASEAFEYGEEFYSMSAITVAASEFGTFLDPHNREMIDVMTDLWDGKATFEKMTKTQGSDTITNPWINVLACTTPSWIANNFPDYMIGGGFLSRCIFVYGKKKRHLIAYPGDWATAADADLREKLVHDLEIISTQMVGEFTLTPEAKAWGITWYEDHCNKLLQAKVESFRDYAVRKQTHMHKIAMVLSASQTNELVIDLETLQTAEKVLSQAEIQMTNVFKHIGSTPEGMAIHEVVAMVTATGGIEVQELYKQFMGKFTAQQFSQITESCIISGQVRKVQKGSAMMLYPTTTKVEADIVNLEVAEKVE